MPTLEEVLADERMQSDVLAKNGHKKESDVILRVCQRVEESAEEYLRFLSEPDAMLRSNRSAEWLRSQFPKWAQAGHAEKRNGKRYYRTILIPQRANLSAVREEGRRAGMKAAS